MIPSPNWESRGNARVRLVVLHTSEGARDVTSLGHYLQNPAVQASYHAAFDDQRMETFVDYSNAAWSVLSANKLSDNGCMCGFAAWPRSEWLSHTTMLELAAQWVAARCTARKIPIRRLSLPEVAACAKDPNHPGGVIGHWDWTLGAKDGTHTDPGPNFPWDVVIARAQQIANPAPPAKKGVTVDQFHVQGMDTLPLFCTVDKTSAIVGQAWISAFSKGPSGGTVKFWFQDDNAGISSLPEGDKPPAEITFSDGHSNRVWTPVPDGTTMIRVDYKFLSGGVIALEMKPK